MIKIQCNRCGKEIDPRQKVGFIQICSVSPFDFAEREQNESISERAHYCDDCMAEIWNFMQNKVEVSKAAVVNVPVLKTPAVDVTRPREPKPTEQKEEPKQRYKIDYGKIMALKNAGWPVSKIAEEMGMAAQAVSTAIYQYKKRTEAAQQG